MFEHNFYSRNLEGPFVDLTVKIAAADTSHN